MAEISLIECFSLLFFKAIKGESLNKNTDDAQFAIKIEPKENGPLFCETHFYANCCKEVDSNTFK